MLPSLARGVQKPEYELGSVIRESLSNHGEEQSYLK